MIFLFDENMPIRLAKGLEILDIDNPYKKPPINTFLHITELYSVGAGDPDIVKEANRYKAVIISADDDYKTISATYELVIKLRVGYVLFKPPKKSGSTYDEIVSAFVYAWPQLKKAIENEKPPYMYIIERSGTVTKNEIFRRKK